MTRTAAAALLLVLTTLPAPAVRAASAESHSEFVHAYVRALVSANEAAKVFQNPEHLETGSPAQVALFASQAETAKGALDRATAELAPFLDSKVPAIRNAATNAHDVFVARRKMCDEWLAVYRSVNDASGAAAERTAALRALVTSTGEQLGQSAVDAAWAATRIDPSGKPRGWAISWSDRRKVIASLQEAFGNDVVKGPRPGQNYVETAAAAFTMFIRSEGFSSMRITQPRIRR